MKFKHRITSLIVPIVSFTLSTTAFAYNSSNNLDEAEVISATPVYRTIRINQPVEQCWDEPVTTKQVRRTSHTPVILGAILGAAVGNKFGHGRGRDAATVAGAVLGGSLGRDYKRHNKNDHGGHSVHYEQRCEVIDQYHTEERMDGYDVTYRYNNSVYTTHTDRHPGDTITVSVNVVPVE